MQKTAEGELHAPLTVGQVNVLAKISALKAKNNGEPSFVEENCKERGH
jgi:hypothetical protein